MKRPILIAALTALTMTLGTSASADVPNPGGTGIYDGSISLGSLKAIGFRCSPLSMTRTICKRGSETYVCRGLSDRAKCHSVLTRPSGPKRPTAPTQGPVLKLR